MSTDPSYEEMYQRIRELEKNESKRLQVENALRQIETNYHLVTENMNEVIWASDPDLRLTYVSPSTERLYGYSPEERMSQPLDRILTPSSLEKALDTLNTLKTEQAHEEAGGTEPCRSVSLELEYFCKEGSTIWVETTANAVRNRDGVLTGLRGVEREMTERRKAEQIARTLFRISNAVNTSRDLDELYSSIHRILGEIIDLTNFYIALYDRQAGRITFPYFKDTHDSAAESSDLFTETSSLTGKTILAKKPLFLNEDDLTELAAHNRIVGSTPKTWIGVPLIIKDDVIGVMAVQSYDDPDHFDQIDLEILTSVSDQVALAIERKRSEQALMQSEEKFRRLFENAVVGFFQSTPEGRFVEANAAFAKMLGYESPEDLISSISYIETQYYANPEERSHYHRIIKEKGHVDYIEIKALRKDGTEIWVSHSTRAHFDEGGKLTHFEGAVLDITERKRAEEELKVAEETYRNIFLSSEIGLFRSEMHTGLLLDANDAIARFFGYENREDLLAERFSVAARYANPDDRKKVISLLRSHGEFREVEASMLKNDGSIAIQRISGKLRPEKNWIEGVAEDVTERRRIEEEKERLKTQLYQAQKMESIGTLAGGIAHNFNNILMGIQGRASLMMMDSGSSDPNHEHLKEIKEYVRSAAELTRDLLGFARGGKYEARPTDMNELIDQENRLFGRTKKEIRIHDHFEKELWPVEVDQGQMQQALMNIYVNAWQAMPGGGDLYVRTENVTLDEEQTKPFELPPGRYVKISISDTGIGMDAGTREKIFDPFFSTKEVGYGSGLGLASVYGIIKNHGGFIGVHSEEGTGATFIIYLPASGNEVLEESNGPASHDLCYGHGTILLVDDEEMIAEVGRLMLEKLGYRVLVARSGIEALDIYNSRGDEIDLVVLDMIMPGMGGGETFDRLKALDPNVRVLLSSGYSINGQAKEIIDRGCMGFMQKPFTVEDIAKKVREAIAG